MKTTMMKLNLTIELDIEVEAEYNPGQEGYEFRNINGFISASPDEDETLDLVEVNAVLGKKRVTLPRDIGEWFYNELLYEARVN
jgi:hypothetical protein